MSPPAPEKPEERESWHASSVAFDGRAIMIRGPSGSGKSGLALELIALGAELVADDLTRLELVEGRLFALAPPRLQGVIEARGVGLIRAPFRPRAELALLIEMERVTQERLPQVHTTRLLGVAVETICRVEAAHFPAAVRQLVLCGRYR